MPDRHLNLFFSYNSDNELIENNLTRAFVVMLRAVGPSTRERILHHLLQAPLESRGLMCPSFKAAESRLARQPRQEPTSPV